LCLLAGPGNAQSQLDEETNRLRTIEQQISQAKSRAAALDRERAALQAEMADVSGRLVALAGNIQSREARIMESEKKLKALELKEATLRARLSERRGALAELLAGLQRLERNPPPPLAVEPRDATKAVRGALLFGAIVPDLKGQAASLSRELAELDAVRERIITGHAELNTHISNLAPARKELEKLLARKKDLLARTARELETEQARATALGKKAEDIRELLASLAEERRQAAIRAAEEKARQLAEAKAAEEAQRLAAEEAEKAAEAARLAKTQAEQEELKQREEARRLAALKARQKAEAIAEENRRAEAAAKARAERKSAPVKFASSVGKLAYPAQGELVRKFNDKDGFGGRSEGLHIATRKQAQITASVDGTVEFAGEFRSYGKLVIINTGDGYHLLLAGLENITVAAGQKLLAGEPVGTMGAHTARGTLIGDRIDDPRPILYVEVRKGSEAIDSSRWWADQGQKAATRRNNGGNEG
jgi:septal ring factor EnvC (AmiA/AmiB activator)